MTTSTTRAAVYLRQSLDTTGEQLAVQRQREDCVRIAEQRGWQVVAEFVDNSISASDKRKARPGYDELVVAYEGGQFEALICYDLDRLTRQPRQLEDWIDAAQDRGLRLVTANGECDLSTDGGRLFARIKASVARSEVERKSARQRSAARQRSEHGRPPLGVRLTGYTPSGVTIPDEAERVEAIFERFVAGDSLRGIAAWLAESGVTTRHGRPWNPSSVRTILTNHRYASRAVYQGKVTGKTGGWTPIVDDDLFDLVQGKLADPRRKTQQGTDRKHLGAGLFQCDECAVKVRSWSGNRYRCPNGCITRAQANIDEFVLDTVFAYLSQENLADLIAPEDSPQAKEVAERVQGLRARLASIDDDYDGGKIDGTRHQVATDKTRALLAKALAEQAALGANRGAASTLLSPDPAAAFEAAPLMIRRTTIDFLCSVSLAPTPRGRKTFDTNSVKIQWRN